MAGPNGDVTPSTEDILKGVSESLHDSLLHMIENDMAFSDKFSESMKQQINEWVRKV